MNKDNQKWLKEEFPKYQKRILRGEVLNAYYTAEMLLNGVDKINKRGCYCEYGSLKDSVESKYSKWLQTYAEIHPNE